MNKLVLLLHLAVGLDDVVAANGRVLLVSTTIMACAGILSLVVEASEALGGRLADHCRICALNWGSMEARVVGKNVGSFQKGGGMGTRKYGWHWHVGRELEVGGGRGGKRRSGSWRRRQSRGRVDVREPLLRHMRGTTYFKKGEINGCQGGRKEERGSVKGKEQRLEPWVCGCVGAVF